MARPASSLPWDSAGGDSHAHQSRGLAGGTMSPEAQGQQVRDMQSPSSSPDAQCRQWALLWAAPWAPGPRAARERADLCPVRHQPRLEP